MALIKLDRDVDEANGRVGFACLSNSYQVHPGDTIYAIGWGYTEKSRNQGFFKYNIENIYFETIVKF